MRHRVKRRGQRPECSITGRFCACCGWNRVHRGRVLQDFDRPERVAMRPRSGDVAGGEFGESQVGQGIRFGAGLRKEGQRIHDLPRAERHEAMGAFVAGFQGALVLAGAACVVGGPGGYFTLPRSWHSDWERAWTETDGQVAGITRANLERGPAL
jgi:hypothetical protein